MTSTFAGNCRPSSAIRAASPGSSASMFFRILTIRSWDSRRAMRSKLVGRTWCASVTKNPALSRSWRTRSIARSRGPARPASETSLDMMAIHRRENRKGPRKWTRVPSESVSPPGDYGATVPTTQVSPLRDRPVLRVDPGDGSAPWLVVADLHLGLTVGDHGAPGPPEGSPGALRDRLLEACEASGVRRLVVAGDVKHPIVGT